jgi:hypothetical protein
VTLFFIPGAPLRAAGPTMPADWGEVVSDGNVDEERSTELYERRLRLETRGSVVVVGGARNAPV